MSNVQHIRIGHAFDTVVITWHAWIPCQNFYQMRCWNVQINYKSLITQQSVPVLIWVNVTSETCVLSLMNKLYCANKLMTFCPWNQCIVKNNLYHVGGTSRVR
jgi:hypothetical protein